MKRVLLISPTPRERARLPAVAAELGLDILYEDFDGGYFDHFLGCTPDFARPRIDVVHLIERTAAKYRTVGLAGVTSAVGYPGMSAASVVARRLGLPGPPVEALMLCDHKYYSRLHQLQHVPQATPQFRLIDPRDPSTLGDLLPFPSFLKPVKSCMSRNAFKVRSEQELRRLVRAQMPSQRFVEPFNDMLRAYTGVSRDASGLLQETLLQGAQVSLEGFVFEREVRVLGIVDAIMFPGTLAFKRFQYPSRLPADVQERMIAIATCFVTAIGYDNAMFNMELFYDAATDSIAIVEINPKIASQFPGLFEKVDGYSTYRTMLELATGQPPLTLHRKGGYRLAASCVLRTFDDQHVLTTPTAAEIGSVAERFPDTRVQVCTTAGGNLSDEVQDSCSFRYGLIELGANDETDLEGKFEKCRSMLTFRFRPRSRTSSGPAARCTYAVLR